MSFIGLFLIAVGLSMDAFAVSICKGLSVKKLSPKHALLVGVYFGGFQFLMPVIGLTLPFVSYGGTSIVTLFAAMGMASGIQKRTRPEWLR